MIQIGIGLIIGFFLGLFVGNKQFRNKVNEFFKGITGFLSKVEFRRNNKKPVKKDYENYYNLGLYCVISGYRTKHCHVRRCRHCPIYLEYKSGEKNKGKPIGLNEDYW